MSDATDRDEDDWLGRVAAGDRGGALVALYRAYAPRIHRLGLRTLRDTGHAEELVQETFVRLWQSAHRFDPERGSARAFTFTIGSASRSTSCAAPRRARSSRPPCPTRRSA